MSAEGMNRYLKKAVQILLPQRAFVTIQSIRSRNYQMRLHREWGVAQATQEMVDVHGLTVMGGPFRGMRYPRRSLLNRDGIPLLFGTYELELQPVIEEIVLQTYDRIVDIGSAEGYYAVGLALRTQTPIYAFDCEPRERRYLRQMARLNQVSDLIHTGPWCDFQILSDLVNRRRCLVISDCEGFEFDLFNDESVALLRKSDLIIELHEFGPELKLRNELIKRFQATHNGRIIAFSPENLGSSVPDKWGKFAREFRNPEQQWLCLKSQTRMNP